MGRQALPLFSHLHHSIFYLNSATISPQNWQACEYVHKRGIFTKTCLTNRPLSVSADHHSLTDDNVIINSIPEPNVISFSTLIYSFAKLNHFGQAILAFSQMLSYGIMHDGHVLPTIVKACAGLSLLKTGKQVHCIASTFGFDSDSHVLSPSIHMYIKCNRIKDAHKVFNRLPQPDIVAYSALLAGYARKGCVKDTKVLFSRREDAGVELNLISWNGMIVGFTHSKNYSEAVIMFQKMHLEGFRPDGTSFSSVLSAVGGLKILDMGFQIHGLVIKQGLEQKKCVVTALTDMYGKCARTLEVSKVFDEIYQVDIGACNALVTGLSRNGLVDNALKLFRKFKFEGFELNVVSWTSIIASCSQNGKDIEALEIFREMQDVGV